MFKILEKYKYLLSLILLAIIAICITYSHNISFIVDCGREAYYPQEILAGKVLYKDLFNIYGPFSYLFNALLYKIFGVNLNVLSVAGAFCGLGIILGIYFIAQVFLKEKIAFGVGLLAVVIGIIPCHILNYVFPYSFGMTYGLCAFLFSLLSLIYYVNSNKNYYLYISLFLASLATCCKYEFISYLLVYIFVFIKMKPTFKVVAIGLLSFGLIYEICFAYLFAKGFSISDLTNTIHIITTMSQTFTLKYFYSHSGIFFHKQALKLLFKSFLLLFIPIFVFLIPIIFKNKINNRVVSSLFIYGAICLMLLFQNNKTLYLFMSLPVVLLLVSIFNYKKIWNDLSLSVTVISVFVVSLKVFWGPLLSSYGTYYIPMLAIAIMACFKDKLTENYRDYLGFYITVLSLSMLLFQLKFLQMKNYKISTDKGTVYVGQNYKKTGVLLNYIKNNTKKTDKILIFPEGMMINFLCDRKTDDFYNSMLPLYEETFGAETYVEHFQKNMPDYIIFNSWNSSDYYFSIICRDYGFKICEFTEKNYNKILTLSGLFSYAVYKKK